MESDNWNNNETEASRLLQKYTEYTKLLAYNGLCVFNEFVCYITYPSDNICVSHTSPYGNFKSTERHSQMFEENFIYFNSVLYIKHAWSWIVNSIQFHKVDISFFYHINVCNDIYQIKYDNKGANDDLSHVQWSILLFVP